MINQTLSPCPQQGPWQMPCCDQDSLCLQRSCLYYSGLVLFGTETSAFSVSSSSKAETLFYPLTHFCIHSGWQVRSCVSDGSPVYVRCRELMSEWAVPIQNGYSISWVWLALVRLVVAFQVSSEGNFSISVLSGIPMECTECVLCSDKDERHCHAHGDRLDFTFSVFSFLSGPFTIPFGGFFSL